MKILEEIKKFLEPLGPSIEIEGMVIHETSDDWKPPEDIPFFPIPNNDRTDPSWKRK